MVSINESKKGCKQFLEQVKAELRKVMLRLFEKELEKEVDERLNRASHQRRSKMQKRSGLAYCQACGSRELQNFSRNGHRRRQILSQLGVLDFWLPRVVCTCGGSVKIPFSVLEPYQRIWDDLEAQIERWAQLGLSLRQMQGEIAKNCESQVGLRSLNQRVQDVATPPRVQLTSVPPVVMLDAIWLSLLEKTGTKQSDSQERQRAQKSRRKVCILVALGLYPQTGNWGVLDWQLAQSESQSAWEALLLPLEARGLYRQRGLELFIHDGGKGLIAALNLLYPHIPHQRCLFHKLRNLWQSIQVPKNLTTQDARTFKRALLQEAQGIFYAQTVSDARERRDQFIQNYRQSQFDFVTSLERDWPETMAFFQVLKRFPSWRRSALRTTSLLERLNRNLRRLFRSAGAFHSISGLLAAVARVLNPKRLI